jgi:hypothetical protein
MSERAHITELALVQVVWVRLAKLGLIFFRMVEVLDGVVGVWASVT